MSVSPRGSVEGAAIRGSVRTGLARIPRFGRRGAILPGMATKASRCSALTPARANPPFSNPGPDPKRQRATRPAARRARPLVGLLVGLCVLSGGRLLGQRELRSTDPVVGIRKEAPRAWALTGARIVVAPGKSLRDATLVVRDGRIAAVGEGGRDSVRRSTSRLQRARDLPRPHRVLPACRRKARGGSTAGRGGARARARGSSLPRATGHPRRPARRQALEPSSCTQSSRLGAVTKSIPNCAGRCASSASLPRTSCLRWACCAATLPA